MLEQAREKIDPDRLKAIEAAREWTAEQERKPKVDPARLKAVKEAIPEDVLDALRTEAVWEYRFAKRRKPSYAAVVDGLTPRKKAPLSFPEDRKYIPGALRHWRKVHGLTMKQAQSKIGYSPNSSSWSHWEFGFDAPPYQTLLRIIAATGLGHWVDDTEDDPNLRLDIMKAAHKEQLRRRRKQSKAASNGDGS